MYRNARGSACLCPLVHLLLVAKLQGGVPEHTVAPRRRAESPSIGTRTIGSWCEPLTSSPDAAGNSTDPGPIKTCHVPGSWMSPRYGVGVGVDVEGIGVRVGVEGIGVRVGVFVAFGVLVGVPTVVLVGDGVGVAGGAFGSGPGGLAAR
jgi:hypothetical protein